MLLLALDTSTPAVTVALHDGERVLAEATNVDPRRHTELLMPLVTDVLARAGAGRRDLTELAVGVGPGPFTGLRVGLAAARTMGAVLDLPVRGVCSLDVLAYGVLAADPPGEPFAVATDARRREVYWARYDSDGARAGGPDVGPAGDIGAHGRPAAGAGARLYPDAFARALDPEYPSAAHLAAAVVAQAVEILSPDPLYLRRPDATPPSARKSVLTR
ncbi:tRNA (adenosine(37)-N6)-threonylcarbamoyltransferase complex dimerization subunit type 1 TsaB [Jiangella aurantiaca]|uniref:tRNA (Adenosine(37)-N6)-threonylcarbamoyltransferase complex dimerization subunit type 1 TsaB n=1 Tax=Jiangella aurantiaca TaxID=2530373 RepID=A0A4R5AKM1_9ACTN|nr:tRNA (adenosine(37)-N6)-threonylcarbamoyltransferase complex dimerization subunit type 1 TsaB [Jiangella aurantiaca]TDD71979.1 tRNA (adenosine(37)-N6)-threonylcarbamoyltransferase complex dimerization subunit type 1 TsaB [Jiangella aurantiaca]